MNKRAIVISLLSLLAFIVFLAINAFAGLEGVALSLHGKIALGLGVSFTLGLAGGLMYLVYYSAREGHDAAVHQGAVQTQEEV